MKLNPAEIESTIWKRIETELVEEKRVLLNQLAGDKTHDESNRIRGKIAAVKSILAWAETDPKIED